MKRFFTISALVLIGLSALACGPWIRPNYYIFSAFNRNSMYGPFDDRLNQFWADYVGKDAIESWSMDNLAWTDLDKFNESTNPIIVKAIKSRDTEMQQYLRNLIWYLQTVNRMDVDNDWDYPTKEALANYSGDLQMIQRYAKNYKGTRLRAQHSLLEMRTLLALRDIPGMLAHWNNGSRRVKGSVYEDMERAMMAFALLHKDYSSDVEKVQARSQARRIYAEVGDYRSLKWLVRNMRNLAGIQTEYVADPNNPTLLFLVQDFVNNAQDYYDTVNSEWYDPAYPPENIEIYHRQTAAFIDFAKQVVAQGKTREPALWQTAAGYLTHLAGNSKLGVELIDKALKMQGSPRVLDNARACRFIASLGMGDLSDKALNYAVEEIKWLQQVAKQDSKSLNAYGESSNHYIEVITVATYDRLAPMLKKNGMMSRAMALQNALKDVTFVSGEVETSLSELTAEETIDYLAYMKSKSRTDFDRFVKSVDMDLEINSINDLIGTKYIREGAFAKAIPYLEKVPISYLNNQGIARYAAARTYKKARWLGRQVVDRDWNDMVSTEHAPLTRNQKIDFCRDVLALQSAEPTAENLLALATLYYQASYKGDCWYLPRYSWSYYDTVCYKNEFPFVEKAVQLLQQARDKATRFETKQECLYALSFIPFGEPYVTYTWDENYNQVPHYNRNSYEYINRLALYNFYIANRNKVAPYVSRCDVLRTFHQ